MTLHVRLTQTFSWVTVRKIYWKMLQSDNSLHYLQNYYVRDSTRENDLLTATRHENFTRMVCMVHLVYSPVLPGIVWMCIVYCTARSWNEPDLTVKKNKDISLIIQSDGSEGSFKKTLTIPLNNMSKSDEDHWPINLYDKPA